METYKQSKKKFRLTYNIYDDVWVIAMDQLRVTNLDGWKVLNDLSL